MCVAAGIAIAAGPCASKVLACGAPQLAAHLCLGSAALHYISLLRGAANVVAQEVAPLRSSRGVNRFGLAWAAGWRYPWTPRQHSIGLTDHSIEDKAPHCWCTRRSLPLCSVVRHLQLLCVQLSARILRRL